jgi:hypothetical protein
MGCDEPAKYKSQCSVSKITFPVLYIGVIYTFYIFCLLLLYIDVWFIPFCGYFSLSHISLSFLSPYYLCARPRWFSRVLVSMCAPFSVYSLVSAPHVRFFWSSFYFWHNLTAVILQWQHGWPTWTKLFTIQLLVEKPKSNIWSKISRLLLTPVVFYQIRRRSWYSGKQSNPRFWTLLI